MRRGSPLFFSDSDRANTKARLSRLIATGSEVIERSKAAHLADDLPRCVCVPNSRCARGWDLYTLTMLVYVAIVTPFQMAFLFENDLSNIDTWLALFILDRIVDLTFLVDMVVSFRSGWVVEHPSGTIEYRYSCKEGSIRYLKTFFVVDLLSILPMELLDLIPTVESSNWSRLSKIFKLFRFAKLMKILRATRIFARWEKTLVLSMPYGAIRLVKFCIIFFVVVHWLACIFYFIEVLEQSAGVQFTWVTVTLTAAEQSNVWESYVASLTWSLATITTVGYGDVKPVATAERAMAVVGMIIGTTMFAFVIGTMINLLEGFMVRKTSFQNYMDVLSSYAFRAGLPRHLLKRLHNFGFEMEERFDIPYDRHAESKALEMLSPFLRAEVQAHVYHRALAQTELLMLAEPEQKKELVRCMASHLTRRTHGHYETVCDQGHAAKQLYILAEGSLTVQRIDIRRRSWNVETKLQHALSDFGAEAVLFPTANCRWHHTYKTEGNMCFFFILTASAFKQVLVEVPDSIDCITRLKRVMTRRRIGRFLRRPQTPEEILTLIKEFRDQKAEEHSRFNQSSDGLLRVRFSSFASPICVVANGKSNPKIRRSLLNAMQSYLSIGVLAFSRQCH